LVQTEADYKRQAALAQSGAQSQQVVELAKANFDVAKSSVTAAQAAIEQAKAQVNQKEAGVAVAKTNLAYTTIRSPIDGIVVARNVDVGRPLPRRCKRPPSSTSLRTSPRQLYAKIDESDVGRIKLGQDVKCLWMRFQGSLPRHCHLKRMNATT
jgi:HlyD family secretion protein